MYGKIKKITCLTVVTVCLGYAALVTCASIKVWTAHEPPPFSFWHIESLPHGEKQKTARDYFMQKISASPQEIMQELTETGARCGRTETMLPVAQEGNAYTCIYKIGGLWWKPWPIAWMIEIFTENGTDKIVDFHSHTWGIAQERIAETFNFQIEESRE